MIGVLGMLACPAWVADTGDPREASEERNEGCVPGGTGPAALAPPFERMDLGHAVAVVPASGTTCPAVFASGWIGPDYPERPMAFWLREPPVTDGAIIDTATAVVVYSPNEEKGASTFGVNVATNADGSLLAVPATYSVGPDAEADEQYRGFVYLFDGEAAEGTIDETSAVATLSGTPWDAGCEPCGGIGRALALGDVTGDGIDDLALSAPAVTEYYPDGDRGMVWFVPGVGNRGEYDIDENDRLIEDTFLRMERFGQSLEIADLNGDGVGDLVVTEPRYEDEAEWGGRVYVFAGPISSIPLGEPDITIDGGGIDPSKDLYFGAELAVGDATGDGYADIAVSADYDEELYLFAGPVESGTHVDAAAVIEADGQAIPESLDIAGAMDGALPGQIVIGAHQVGEAGEGAVYLVPAPFAPRMELAAADATFLGQRGSHMGSYVASLGDADGDGEIDIVAHGYDDSGQDSLWFLYSSGR